MDVVVECCAGLDVHQATVVACVITGQPGRKARKEIRTFGTMRQDLETLRAWLSAAGCELVAMESTGVYWKPVYDALEDHFDVIVANARHIKNVPGRKTDVKDCEWIAELARHGLIARGFVPPRPIRRLRELNRFRAKLSQLQAGERNRLIKVLETAGNKLAGVASDVFGVSGRRMIRALIAGENTPEDMAGLALGPLRRKQSELARALEAPLGEHQRMMLHIQLDRVERAEADLARVDATLSAMAAPYGGEIGLLMTIPGVDRITALTIVAEIGVNMAAFHSADHLAAWAGLCPGNHQSAGKQRGGGTRKGNVLLKTALVRASVNATRGGGTFLGAAFRRLARRRGQMRAHVAIAHKILVSAWHMLTDGTAYRDLGADYADRVDASRVAKTLVRRLDTLGFDVQLTKKAA